MTYYTAERYRCPDCGLETNRSERGKWVCPRCYGSPTNAEVYMKHLGPTDRGEKTQDSGLSASEVKE